MNDHREGIQADKPVPPWEQPGCFRRDCEPHRGDMLWWLGCASFILGNLALVPCFVGLPNLLGTPLGLTTWMLARSDLAKMQKGVMDPRGEKITAEARLFGVVAFLLLPCVNSVCWLPFVIKMM